MGGVGFAVRVFDTVDFAPNERRDAFMEAFAGSEVPQQVSFAAGVDLSARLDLWNLAPGVHLLKAHDTGVRLTRSVRHLRVTAPERIAFTFSRRTAVSAVGTSSRRLRPGDLHVNDQTLPSDYVVFGEGGAEALIVDYDVLGLPIALGRRAVLSVDSSPTYDLFRRHMGGVCDAIDAMAPNDPAALSVASATLELARALLATSAGSQRSVREAMHDTELLRVQTYIDQHLNERDLGPAKIARASHMSIRRLYKVWDSSGLSLTQYIIARRLDRASQDLQRATLRSKPISQIARSCGFADAAHFSRRFRAAYGVSPREWRQRSWT